MKFPKSIMLGIAIGVIVSITIVAFAVITAKSVNSIEDAKSTAEDFAKRSGYSDLFVSEIHQFKDGTYEVVFKEKEGKVAFQLTVEKNGNVYYEHGPNMMWNTKYGMHGNNGMMNSNFCPMGRNYNYQSREEINESSARKIAENYIANLNGNFTLSNETEINYGYYEFMILKDGNDYAEICVNSYTSEVWYEDWHSEIVKSVEYEVK